MHPAANPMPNGEVVLPAGDLNETLAFLTELGFSLEMVAPADNPAVAVLSGFGLRVRLEGTGAGGVLRIASADGERALVAPNGTRIELVSRSETVSLPDLESRFSLARPDHASWLTGRAGMQYRDLIPGRLGGRYIASHIRIPDGGEVPDYVHFHRVRFQLIYCVAGWVEVVYEGQGEPFVLEAGDCVVQPPEIRHRVLECSAGLEVVEVGCPAWHETHVDHALALPTEELTPEREFDGQRFVRHRSSLASWAADRHEDFEVRDLGVASATGDLCGAAVLRASGSARSVEDAGQAEPLQRHALELALLFVLEGRASFRAEGAFPLEITRGDAVVIPAAMRHRIESYSNDFEFLEVTSPAAR